MLKTHNYLLESPEKNIKKFQKILGQNIYLFIKWFFRSTQCQIKRVMRKARKK